MFVANNFVYLQMQKTGCSHISSLMSKICEGKSLSKHSVVRPSDVDSDKKVISSIRNPWSWYVSLWTYGVQGDGHVFHNLTKPRYAFACKLFLQDPVRNYASLLHAAQRHSRVDDWRSVYTVDSDIKAFRQWMKMISEPDNAYNIDEGYGNSTISKSVGFMTYRYLYLTCLDFKKDNKSVINNGYSGLEKYDSEHCSVDYFIRQENLEDDFCKAMGSFIPLDKSKTEMIYGAKKVNTSKRKFPMANYYDQETIDLVSSRDQLIIDKFGYQPPLI